MSWLVDTSVWSLALRRDRESEAPEVAQLRSVLTSGQPVFTTGLVLQELLHGFVGPKARTAILERFEALPTITPERVDHVAAAELRNTCRRRGVQIGTIDALLIALCLRHELLLLTTDADFQHASRHVPLQCWTPTKPRAR
jgi:predicted nucleic acid-binding protein